MTTPQQAALNFSVSTRQHMQPIPSVAGAAGATVAFQIPKVRLTSKVRVMVEATLTAIHANQTSYTPAPFAPFTLIRRVNVDVQSGFQPFKVSGEELYLYSLMRDNAFILQRQDSGRGKVVQGITASSGQGTDNRIRFVFDLPLTLNDRDPVGLILTQNQETTVSVTIDLADAAALHSGASGFTFNLSNISITPMVESFGIPTAQDARPDLSVIKLVQSTKQVISGSGEQTVKLPVGTTYRKLIFYVEDNNGGVSDDDLNGNIELLFNQADTPYKVNPKILAAYNHEQFGHVLPQGVYAFDFSYQGIANYGGSRDVIDTERLTEFWLRFNASNAGNVTCVYELLSRLQG